MTLESLGVEPTGDLEMVEAIRQEVRRLCQRDSIVAHILQEDETAEYASDYKRLFTTETEQGPLLRVGSQATKISSRVVSCATSESSRGWDPILAGFHARERMSRAPTPRDLVMRRSYLPMDLNSTSSENSESGNMDKWDDLSEHSESEAGSGNEPDNDEAHKEIENQGGQGNVKKNERNVPGETSQRSTSSSKVEISEDQRGVVSNQAEENGGQGSDTLFELESNKDDPELINITSPGPSDYDQSDADAGVLGASAVSSQRTDS